MSTTPQPPAESPAGAGAVARDDDHLSDRRHVVEATSYAESRAGAHLADDGSGTRITTTNAERGAGSPRFIIGGARADERSGVAVEHVLLTHELTTIGSASDAAIGLDGLEPVHATVHHTIADEYVLVLHGPAETSGNPSVVFEGGPAYALRHGFELRIGSWTLVFQRDEYADHGRPFGGREGGEFSIQTRQHPRIVPEPEVRRYEVPGE